MRPAGYVARLVASGCALVGAALLLAHLGVASLGARLPSIVNWTLLGCLGLQAIFGLMALPRRRDNAGQVPRIANWTYSLARWAVLPVLLFCVYHPVGASTMGLGDHLRLAVFDAPGLAAYGAGLLAVALYVGRGVFGATLDLGLLSRAAAARGALVLSALIVGLGGAALARGAHG